MKIHSPWNVCIFLFCESRRLSWWKLEEEPLAREMGKVIAWEDFCTNFFQLFISFVGFSFKFFYSKFRSSKIHLTWPRLTFLYLELLGAIPYTWLILSVSIARSYLTGKKPECFYSQIKFSRKTYLIYEILPCWLVSYPCEVPPKAAMILVEGVYSPLANIGRNS